MGNSRVSFDSNGGGGMAKQVDDYYPFGLDINNGYSVPKNQYLYNGKELQAELNQYDYGARFYDPVIGRFTTLDPIAEHFPWMTGYQYGSNNPSSKIDLDGLEGIFAVDFFFENTSITPRVGPVAEVARLAPENIAKAGGEIAGKPLKPNSSGLSPEAFENFRRGNAAEAQQLAKNGLEKNTKPYEVTDPKTGEKGITVPDAVKEDGTTVEIKNVSKQGLTKQLRLQEKMSNDAGGNPELIINQGAKLSTPLKNSTFDINTYTAPPIVTKQDNTKTPSPVRPTIVRQPTGPLL